MAEESFAEAVKALAETVGPLNDDAVRAFLATFPLEDCLRELSVHDVPDSVVNDAAAGFTKIFSTQLGLSLLPSSLPYATAALHSPSAPLRRLAVELLGRMLAVQPLQSSQHCLDNLLHALQDESTGVAAAAEEALSQLGHPAVVAQLPELLAVHHEFGGQLAQLCDSADPLLRMRSLTLLVALAAQSPAAAQAVHASGLLHLLLEALEEPDDLLSCMAALQLVRDAAERCHPGMAGVLVGEVMPRIRPLLSHEEPVLQCGALRAAASLLSAALEAECASPAGHIIAMANGMTGGCSGQVGPLLSALKGLLDAGGTAEVAGEVEAAALDAAGILGLHRQGATALLLDPASLAADVAYRAFGRPQSPAQRMEALHALAAVAGAERSGRSGKLLPQAAEDVLRVAVFQGAAAAWPGATPAEVALRQLEQPFLEQRVGLYRCLVALAARDWMAAQVCSHAELLARLTNAGSESGKQGCEWRYACVSALAATIADVAAGGIGAGSTHQPALLAAAEQVRAAVRAGPYGGSAVTQQEQHVATVPGL